MCSSGIWVQCWHENPRCKILKGCFNLTIFQSNPPVDGDASKEPSQALPGFMVLCSLSGWFEDWISPLIRDDVTTSALNRENDEGCQLRGLEKSGHPVKFTPSLILFSTAFFWGSKTQGWCRWNVSLRQSCQCNSTLSILSMGSRLTNPLFTLGSDLTFTLQSIN